VKVGYKERFDYTTCQPRYSSIFPCVWSNVHTYEGRWCTKLTFHCSCTHRLAAFV